MIFKTEIPINSKDFLSLNAYYLRKYIGVKEVLLLAFLFVAGMVLGLWAKNFFILIMCLITLILMTSAIVFYFATAVVGFKAEFTKRQATKWEITFSELGMEIVIHEKNGEQKYTEKRLYTDIEKIALLKDRIYIYLGAALMYYIKHDNVTEGNFVELCEFLKENIEPTKFKMKNKRKKKDI